MVNKRSLMGLALLLALAGGARTERGAIIDFTADDDLIVGARAIVIGRVLGLESRWDAEQDRVFTYVTVSVEAVLKGDIREPRIVLKEEGGEADGQGSLIFGGPQFSPGERALLYLDTWRDGSLRVHQLYFGKLAIIHPPGGDGEIVVRPERGCGAAAGSAARRRSGRASAANSMALAAYRRMVQTRLAANRERAQAFESAHYAEKPLLARPLEYDRVRSRGEMRPQFTLLYPVKSVRWFEPDNGQPVVFYVNPDGAPNPQVIDDVDAAIKAWSNIAGCRLRVDNGGARTVCASQRTLSAISFNNCDNRFSPSPQQGRVIALGGLRWTSNETKQVNGQTFVKAAYGFVSFNPFAADAYDDHCDLREVATHELGHALGLNHSQYPEATMNGGAHFDGRCASLTDDDVNGVVFLYPVDDLGPRPLAIDSGPALSEAVLQVNYTQPIVSSGGILPHTWSVVPGYGRLPAGLDLNTGGIIIGVPLETGTFEFEAQAQDGEGTVRYKSFTITVREPLPYDSRCLSQSVISTVQAGQTIRANLKWLNVGSQTWDAATVRLVSQNPAGNHTWGVASVAVTGFTLKNEQLITQFTLTAPRAAGTYNIQWQLSREGGGFFGQPSANLKVVVAAGPPFIENAGPLQAVAGSAFSHQLSVAGGTPPFTWSIVNGLLPAGLSLNPLTGIISGTPAAAGSSTFTAQVIDAASRAAQKALSITVAPGDASPLRLNLAAAIPGVKGMPVNYQPEATGGTPPYAWSITAGALPPGMTLNADSGLLAGTPAASGDFNLTITVRDQRNASASASMAMKIAEPAPAITRVKYKSGKRKLIVFGERIDSGAALLVDGAQVASRFDAGTLIAKPVPLASGAHEIRVVNPGGGASPPYSLTVE